MYAHIVAGRSPADRRSKMERAVTPPADMYETKDEVVP